MTCDNTGDAAEDSSAGKGDKSDKHSIGKRIGEFLILALYLAIDAFEIWPHSRLFAATSLPIGLLALLLLDGGFSKKHVVTATGILTFLCLIVYLIFPAELVSEIEVTGLLQPGSDPTPPNSCPAANDPNSWKIMFGKAAVQFAEPVDVPFLKIGSCPVLRISKDKDGIAVTGDLFDNEGRLIASIQNNSFHALSGAHSRVDRDHNLSKLIVLDGNGNEILFVHYMNRSTVRVRGVFGCPGYRMIPFKDDAPIPGFEMIGSTCTNVLKGVTFSEAFMKAD